MIARPPRSAGWTPYLSAGLAVAFAAAIVASPASSFQASLQGLELWWTIVFPALLPFLMLSEMLAASGAVHAAGVLLEPLMTRVFRLPGCAGWGLALGMTAGCPAGAFSAAELRRQELLSEEEAARLGALSHYASPVTVLVVAGTALLHSPAAGYLLLAGHWLAGLAAGAVLARRSSKPERPRRSGRSGSPGGRPAAPRPPGTARRALNAAAEARARDGRPFGRLLGDSVAVAVQSLMMAGGFIIAFAVAVHIVRTAVPVLPGALASAALEVHLGAQRIAEAAAGYAGGATGMWPMALLAAALGWSGLSAQLQSLAALRRAGIAVRYRAFALHRLLHAAFAAIFLLLLRTVVPLSPTAASVFSPGARTGNGSLHGALEWLPRLGFLLAILILGMLLLSGALSLAGRLQRRP
ncbi:nucleoside recognition protein [Paenibacillus spiritus]|uniref:Nucleoside recognition protein n=1 Tax=Paenibacillus spiritus TaxID=2496557 RepID=A0A5J5G8S2_9BACL|nr:nucleoside recognition protein [Paenibacillus spiritus]KAA9004136.1 nucleoside recognition protein [Paenibacillus spiritus]